MAFAFSHWTSWIDPRCDLLLYPGLMIPGLPTDPVTTSNLAQLRAGRSPLSEFQPVLGSLAWPSHRAALFVLLSNRMASALPRQLFISVVPLELLT